MHAFKKARKPEYPGDVGVFRLSIAGGAFSGCERLKTIYVPVSVVQYEDGAFSGCPLLTSVMTGYTSAEGVGVGEELFRGAPDGVMICFPQEGFDNFIADYFWSRYVENMDVIKD